MEFTQATIPQSETRSHCEAVYNADMAAFTNTSPRSAAPPALRDRLRHAMRDEVSAVAFRLFTVQGFENTTVDQIATEAGLSRASFFRYFGTKEDVVLGNIEELGHEVAAALSARPADERPWDSLRRAFDVLTQIHADEPEKALSFTRLLRDACPLKARHREKQQGWQPCWCLRSPGGSAPTLSLPMTPGLSRSWLPLSPAWTRLRIRGWPATGRLHCPRSSTAPWALRPHRPGSCSY